MADNTTVRPEDVTSVGTRISWGAVLAGAVVALAVYMVLTTLGAAIGFTVGREMTTRALAGGGLVWAILTTAISLFCGGWTTSQLTAGETKCEAMVHGLILWGTIVAAMLWMTTVGVRSGFNAMLSVAYAGTTATDREGGIEELAKRMGYSEERIERIREAIKAKADNAEDKVNDEQVINDARKAVAMVTWGALFGMLLSMGAAIGGAVVGAGPSRTLLWGGRGTLQRTTPTNERQLASHI